MLNSIIRKNLIKILGSASTLSRRKSEIIETYGPMTPDEAGYVIALILGQDLFELPLSIIDKVISLVPKSIPKKLKKYTKDIDSENKKQNFRYPLLSSRNVETAYSLGLDVYPQIFMLENSIRELIKLKFSEFSNDWWDEFVPTDVRKRVGWALSKMEKYPYLGDRGNHPLNYANFSDLKEIITKNKEMFIDVIINIEWFNVKMDDVYMARNNLAHCVPLTPDDKSRIGIFHRDWARLIESAGFD